MQLEKIFFCLLASFLFSSCSLIHTSLSPEDALVPTSPPTIRDTSTLTQRGGEDALILSISHSLRYFEKLPQDKFLIYGDQKVPVQRVKETLIDLKAKVRRWGLTQPLFDSVRREYEFFTSPEPGRITGYYEATLHGSRVRKGKYQYPIYRNPKDALEVDLKRFPLLQKIDKMPSSVVGRVDAPGKVGPYYTREEIDERQVLAGYGLEIAWVDDPVELFFLHIQGSGNVVLDDGSTLRINYAGKNGQPYRAIGGYLIEKGWLSKAELSAPKIKEFLRAHPEVVMEVFRSNPSYVFFREATEGPVGCIGVPVTPYRSIATDVSLVPKGTPAFLVTETPKINDSNEFQGWEPFAQFVLNQDTGGAIKGPGRVDLFTGGGGKNEVVAGYMNRKGRLYFFLKKQE